MVITGWSSIECWTNLKDFAEVCVLLRSKTNAQGWILGLEIDIVEHLWSLINKISANFNCTVFAIKGLLCIACPP